MSKVFSRLCSLSLSRRTLARVMAAVFFVSLIPLIVIAVYNYPADDDFNFVLPAADAWVRTGSLVEVVKAIWNKGVDTYASWQGDFVSTALFSITPIIFNIRLYFLSNWFTLALLCLSAGYLIKGVVCVHLKADRATFWIVYVATMVLVLQFMPAIGWSVYWHNGGIYTVTACFLALLLVVTLGVSFSLVPAALWPSVPKLVDNRYMGSAYATIFWIQNLGLMAFPMIIGWVLNKVNPGVGEAIKAGEHVSYNYTVPMLIFASLGVLAFLLAFWLKLEDRKKHYGLELPNIKK